MLSDHDMGTVYCNAYNFFDVYSILDSLVFKYFYDCISITSFNFQ